MKKLLLIALLALPLLSNAQTIAVEASTNQMALGTAGAPYYVTPRRLTYLLQLSNFSGSIVITSTTNLVDYRSFLVTNDLTRATMLFTNGFIGNTNNGVGVTITTNSMTALSGNFATVNSATLNNGNLTANNSIIQNVSGVGVRITLNASGGKLQIDGNGGSDWGYISCGTNIYNGAINVNPNNTVTPAGYMPITNGTTRYYVPLYQ